MAASGPLEQTRTLMAAFAERTGLTSSRPPQRYLWTDAFAVCNYLSLARRTGEGSYLDLALRLVDQVHHVLGRHRADDGRSGWLGGASEQEGESHPTRGGLRIGKRLPERRPDEPFDEQLEWDRDGQYFHYLTRWMHALDQVARATGDARFNLWARELAAAAHDGFVFAAPVPGGHRMAWKMSTDLSRPLVTSMGQHDPLDGYLTCVQLRATAAELSHAAEEGPPLDDAIASFAAMLAANELRTTDPLGLGGLLADAYRVAQLVGRGALDGAALLQRLLDAALVGVRRSARHDQWHLPAPRRLAFRELGLAIGLASVERLEQVLDASGSQPLAGAPLRSQARALAAEAALGRAIVAFWTDPAHRAVRSWSEHLDINEVMLATSLLPEGYLVLSAPEG
jgi:hypothetical protein